MWMKSNIEKLIEESGLRKSFIYNKLGVNYRQLRNYETGHSLIPIDKAFILADLLGVKVDDLYARQKVEHPEKDKPTKEEYLSEQIEMLDFEPRIFLLLKRNGIHTYADLLKQDLNHVRGAGPKAKEILEAKTKEMLETLENEYK